MHQANTLAYKGKRLVAFDETDPSMQFDLGKQGSHWRLDHNELMQDCGNLTRKTREGLPSSLSRCPGVPNVP